MSVSPIDVRPAAGALGAHVHGVDLADVSNPVMDSIVAALDQYGVLFFREQTLSRAAQLHVARRFGAPEVHPIANGMAEHPAVIRVHKPAGERAFFGTSWHTDNSFFAEPSGETILYGDQVPPVGGDTVFASMERAWETLSPTMQAFLAPLKAVHSAGVAYDPKTTGDAKYKGEAAITYTYSDAIYDEVVHPIARTHPRTGRVCLYVNPMFTLRIAGLAAHESRALLRMLYAHQVRPEFTVRFRWARGSVAIWDNRWLQHYAIDDYPDYERVMYRVTTAGERPV